LILEAKILGKKVTTAKDVWTKDDLKPIEDFDRKFMDEHLKNYLR